MQTSNGLEFKITEITARIRELRSIVGFTEAEMAAKLGMDEEDYISYESGEQELNFGFLYTCAQIFDVDVTDLIEGVSPRLSNYIMTRAGEGRRVEQAHGMTYYNMAYKFKNRIAEPLFVHSVFSPEAQLKPIEVTTHEGQEFDLVISGYLKVQLGSHTEILGPGDTIYYNSSTPHGMIATNGADCDFYAIVLTPEEDIEKLPVTVPAITTTRQTGVARVWEKFITPIEDGSDILTGIQFHNADKFNFAFDVVDALGEAKPDKLALLHIGRDKSEHRFTFGQMKKMSARAANYFRALGIQKGDRVMLVLKRHYQFWPIILALHKLGAVAIPATNQLQEHDFTYRFNAADVRAILCTADGDTAHQVDLAAEKSPTLAFRILVGGSREGWLDFDTQSQLYTHKFVRTADSPCGDDTMLMLFTSGSTGYPKIAAHSYKYPLGHYITARFWHGVTPDGLHFTISDTGWGKALWGKLYGQLMCEGSVFAYDFDRFNAEDILPLFGQYRITTFCAPPTMYRMLIKQDLTKYDFSSLKRATTAGEAMNPEVTRQFEEQTGLRVMEGFGQTETTLSIANLIGAPHKVGSMGQALPLYDIALLDHDGNKVGAGISGEICIRTSEKVPCGLFKGYYRDQARTDDVWHDGWYHTGDVAWKDEDGFFWYVGRADDVIKSSGYRIGPFEIESVIMELPYVLECGVSAAPDEVRGQVVKASIVLTDKSLASDALKKEIQNYVKQHTAPYKYPRIVEFKDELPKTISGKIIRSKL